MAQASTATTRWSTERTTDDGDTVFFPRRTLVRTVALAAVAGLVAATAAFGIVDTGPTPAEIAQQRSLELATHLERQWLEEVAAIQAARAGELSAHHRQQWEEELVGIHSQRAAAMTEHHRQRWEQQLAELHRQRGEEMSKHHAELWQRRDSE